MPPVKGSKRRTSPFRCYACGNEHLVVERGSNTRIIHGVKRTVANATCPNCGAEWWSYHPDAIKAMRAADKKAKELADGIDYHGAVTVATERGTITDVDYTGAKKKRKRK